MSSNACRRGGNECTLSSATSRRVYRLSGLVAAVGEHPGARWLRGGGGNALQLSGTRSCHATALLIAGAKPIQTALLRILGEQLERAEGPARARLVSLIPADDNIREGHFETTHRQEVSRQYLSTNDT